MSVMPLRSILSFGTTSSVHLLQPLHRDVFSSDLLRDLEEVYTQLYPLLTIETNSPFFIRSGRAVLGGQLVRSVMNAISSNSSSIIAAYWPCRGWNISAVHYGAQMNIGEIQYFCKHEVKFSM